MIVTRPQRSAARRRARRRRVLRRLRHSGDPRPHARRRLPRRRRDRGHHAARRGVHRLLRTRGLEEEHARARGIRSWRRRAATSTSCSRRSTSSRWAVNETVLGRASVESGKVFLQEIEIPDEVLRDVERMRHPRLRHVVARGAGRQVPDRVARARAGRGRLRLRVPLPRSDRLEEHARDRASPSRARPPTRWRRCAKPREGRAQHRDLQRRRQHGDARDRRHGLHPRRAGDRRRLDQGLHDAAGRAAPARALPRRRCAAR